MSAKIMLLKVVRETKNAEYGDPEYQALVLGMNKLELLEEMMRFQEERSREGQLTVKMMVQGQILFKALQDTAESDELRELTRTYRRHLKFEHEDFLKKQARKA